MFLRPVKGSINKMWLYCWISGLGIHYKTKRFLLFLFLFFLPEDLIPKYVSMCCSVIFGHKQWQTENTHFWWPSDDKRKLPCYKQLHQNMDISMYNPNAYKKKKKRKKIIRASHSIIKTCLTVIRYPCLPLHPSLTRFVPALAHIPHCLVFLPGVLAQLCC